MCLEFCGLAISLKGRDAGELFLAYDKTENTVLIVDGKRRKIKKPKCKNLRHLKFLPYSEFYFVTRELGKQLTDAQIRRVMARYKAYIIKVQGGT